VTAGVDADPRPGRVRSAYAFIKAHRDRYGVQMMCRVLEGLKPDIFVSGHSGFFGLKEKRARMTKDNPAEALVDREGLQKLIAERRKAFEGMVSEETKK
jgi:hypothetical protein